MFGNNRPNGIDRTVKSPYRMALYFFILFIILNLKFFIIVSLLPSLFT